MLKRDIPRSRCPGQHAAPCRGNPSLRPSHPQSPRQGLERGSASPVGILRPFPRIPKPARPLPSRRSREGHGPGAAAVLRAQPCLGHSCGPGACPERMEQLNGFPKCFPISPARVKALPGIFPFPPSCRKGCGSRKRPGREAGIGLRAAFLPIFQLGAGGSSSASPRTSTGGERGWEAHTALKAR